MCFLKGDLPTSIPPCPPKPKKNKEMNNVHIFPNPGTAEISDAYANDMVYCRELRIALERGDWEKLSEQAFFKEMIAYLKKEGIMRVPSIAMYPEEKWEFSEKDTEEKRKKACKDAEKAQSLKKLEKKMWLIKEKNDEMWRRLRKVEDMASQTKTAQIAGMATTIIALFVLAAMIWWR